MDDLRAVLSLLPKVHVITIHAKINAISHQQGEPIIEASCRIQLTDQLRAVLIDHLKRIDGKYDIREDLHG